MEYGESGCRWATQLVGVSAKMNHTFRVCNSSELKEKALRHKNSLKWLL